MCDVKGWGPSGPKIEKGEAVDGGSIIFFIAAFDGVVLSRGGWGMWREQGV